MVKEGTKTSLNFGTLSGSKWISFHSRTIDTLMTLGYDTAGYDTAELMFTISFHSTL